MGGMWMRAFGPLVVVLLGCTEVGHGNALICGSEGDGEVPDAGWGVPDDVPADFVPDDVPADGEGPDVAGAPFAIEPAVLRLSIRQGETLALPVRVIRAAGFDVPVILTADGLPDMVYAEPSLEVPERAGATVVLEASAVATLVDDAPFTLSGSAGGHRRSVRLLLDVTPGDVDW